MRMLRWISGKTRKDHVRNQVIQYDARVCKMPTFLRQKRLHTHQETTSQEKWWTWLYRRREEGASLDNTREDMKNMKWQLTWLKTDHTGKWWWSSQRWEAYIKLTKMPWMLLHSSHRFFYQPRLQDNFKIKRIDTTWRTTIINEQPCTVR